MFTAYANCVRIPELRKRILFTLGIVAISRLAANIPCPGIDVNQAEALFNNMAKSGGGGLLNMFAIFSGGALQNFAIGTLGIMPYITASIILQLLMPVVPALEKLHREGDAGRQKINQYTRYLTLAVCLVHGTAATKLMMNPSLLTGSDAIQVVAHPSRFFFLSTVLILMAGTMLTVWLGEQISDRGIGNGVSLIITVNIVSSLPSALLGLIALAGAGGQTNIIHVLILLVMFFVVCGATVALTQAVRKIPIRHAKRMVGRRMTSGQTSYLPLRLNFSGVMPLIFGSAILMFPSMIFKVIPYTRTWVRFFEGDSFTYILMYSATIIIFSYFWVATQFNPVQIADNLQKQGGYVPGIRPGQPTSDYLDFVMTRITLAGSLFLTAIAIIPMALSGQFNLSYTIASFFGGTSMLIMVGVMLDSLRQIEAFLLSHHYDGFLTKGHLRSRR